jgi:hypothetical protein
LLNEAINIRPISVVLGTRQYEAFTKTFLKIITRGKSGATERRNSVTIIAFEQQFIDTLSNPKFQQIYWI